MAGVTPRQLVYPEYSGALGTNQLRSDARMKAISADQEPGVDTLSVHERHVDRFPLLLERDDVRACRDDVIGPTASSNTAWSRPRCSATSDAPMES